MILYTYSGPPFFYQGERYRFDDRRRVFFFSVRDIGEREKMTQATLELPYTLTLKSTWILNDLVLGFYRDIEAFFYYRGCF